MRHRPNLHITACGAGAMVIAMTQALAAQGIEYQTKVHVTADDISAIAVHMSYVQLSLLGVPAVVNRRNSLTLEHFDTWPTPAHVLDGWLGSSNSLGRLERGPQRGRTSPRLSHSSKSNAQWPPSRELSTNR